MSNIWDQNQDEEYLEDDLPQEAAGEFGYMENEVVRRIEKAKLYEALLKSPLFDEGAASPEVIDEVRSEFKQYAVGRIQVLLGMRQEGEVSAPSPFSPDEVTALKAVANRMITAKQNPPQVSQATASVQAQPAAPRVHTVAAPRQASPKGTTARPQQRRPAVGAAPARRPSRPKSDNLSSTGQDLSQASNPNAVPMPSNDMMNAHITAQAGRSRAANDSGGGSSESQLLQLAIGLAQNRNKNVKED